MKSNYLIVAVCVLPFLLVAAATQDEPEFKPGEFIVVCPVEEMIDDGVLILVQRALREGRDAAAVIFEVDTPGGRVDSAVKITNAIVEAKVPTIAYIQGMGAISAGALISYACDDIVMAPGSNIGAATPVLMTPEGALPTDEKAVSFVRAKIRALAEGNGHNVDIAEAMVDSDIELTAWPNPEGGLIVRATDRAPRGERTETSDRERDDVDETARLVESLLDALDEHVPVPDDLKEAARQLSRPTEPAGEAPDTSELVITSRGEVVLDKGKLLTLTPEEARRWGVIPIVANEIGEVTSFYGYGNMPRKYIVPTWSEDLFRWLIHPTVAGLLLLLGIGGLYFEVRTPGFGLPGIVGALCLALFFGARAVVGLADWADLLLVVIGVALILVEVFILPGMGLAGVAGALCLMAGIYMSFMRVPIPEYSWDYDRLREMAQTMGVFSVGFVVFLYLSIKVFPRSPLYHRLVLADAQDVDLGYVVQTADQESMVGERGVATSMLRPAGRGRFGNRTYSVVSRWDFIDEGTPIIVVRVEGNRLVVDAEKENA